MYAPNRPYGYDYYLEKQNVIAPNSLANYVFDFSSVDRYVVIDDLQAASNQSQLPLYLSPLDLRIQRLQMERFDFTRPEELITDLDNGIAVAALTGFQGGEPGKFSALNKVASRSKLTITVLNDSPEIVTLSLIIVGHTLVRDEEAILAQGYPEFWRAGEPRGGRSATQDRTGPIQTY